MDSQVEHIHVLMLYLRSVEAIFCGKGRRTREIVLMEARIMGVSSNGEASFLGTVLGVYFIFDSLDSYSDCIHVIFAFLRSHQALICASYQRSCGDVVSVKRCGVKGPFVAQPLKHHVSMGLKTLTHLFRDILFIVV